MLQLPYYNPIVNIVWSGLSAGLLLVACLLAGIHFTQGKDSADPEGLTWVSTAAYCSHADRDDGVMCCKSVLCKQASRLA